jgi:spermidine synthase
MSRIRCGVGHMPTILPLGATPGGPGLLKPCTLPPDQSIGDMIYLFVFFLISGFCSILYELVWLRLAMAQFGVTTALVSTVLSTFMAGLGAGSWLTGRLITRVGKSGIRFSPFRLYAVAEAIIGLGALMVPLELEWGGRILEHFAGQGGLSSAPFYVCSGVLLAVTLVPWCAAMGATIPLAMFAIRNDPRFEARRSFSFLYVANLLGSVVGSVVPLLLIEMNGFRGTLRVGAALNAFIAVAVFLWTRSFESKAADASVPAPALPRPALARSRITLALLFATGLATMGMEVVWIRLFTPYVGPVVYSFATILGTYLLATFAGSKSYRAWSRKHQPREQLENPLLWVSLAVLALFPLVTCDVRLDLTPVLRVMLGIGPVAAVIGFLTPMLVDRWSGGDPDLAGRGYAVNVLGCILGPLLSGFVLLPFVGEHVSMLIFALPWLALGFRGPKPVEQRFAQRITAGAMAAATLMIFVFTKDFETRFERREVRRDSTATVIATGEGMHKRLLTNGVGMTMLTPVTKMMAHVTLGSLDHKPDEALVICFGMGTTFRSLLSWGINVTAVELIPSVPRLFGYYHTDSQQVLASGRGHLVIDDGRRFLERTSATYDAILLDPPPPVSAAGSSLLYSEDFYAVAKQHLRPGGILQQWLPSGDPEVQAAVARALQNSFPYVAVHPSVEKWGWHYFASMTPVPDRTPGELLARMPASAVKDMMEWGPGSTPLDQLGRVLSQRTTLAALIALSPKTPALADDRPINEYFLLRSLAR